jgi:outer membrane cobalamin receptor
VTRLNSPFYGKTPLIVLSVFLTLSAGLSPAVAQTSDQDKRKEEQEKAVRITEEILVVGKVPKEIALATVSTLTATEIERIKPRDISDVVKYVPGCLVTFGDKDTYSLKLRGIDSRRIALLVDGIPVYEPYFSTFDLKTVSAGGIDTLQVTKGPSSVLYGPNTLGGIVNVITARPGDRPYLSLKGSLGDARTRSLGLDTSYGWRRFALSANVLYQDSRAFYYPNKAEGRTERLNSDFERLNLNAKLYYTPSGSTEIMVNGSLYQSEYGMPAALFVQRARYWRFPKWDRSTLNAGGFTSLGGDSTLRFRTYYVNYVNTLDWFDDPEMTELRSQSTYDNSVYGVFVMADFATGGAHQLKTSFLAQRDVARIQDDTGLPWEKCDQGTVSVAVEDYFSLGDHWKIIGGLSLDYIDKFEGGENNSSLNPLVGVKFTPRDELDFHVSFARKSKFPSMRSLYSTSSGNPDLLSESGTSLELSAAYNRGVFITASVFLNHFKDFIDTVRLPDGTRRYYNVGKARINGFEVQAQKSLSWLSTTVNYTFVDHRNETDDRPLDAQSKHNVNFDASFFPFTGFRVGFNGIYGSESWWYDSLTDTVLSIPGYFNLDAIASYLLFGRTEIFVKLSNVFDSYFYTEPGFPWRGRYLEIGFRADVFK